MKMTKLIALMALSLLGSSVCAMEELVTYLRNHQEELGDFNLDAWQRGDYKNDPAMVFKALEQVWLADCHCSQDNANALLNAITVYMNHYFALESTTAVDVERVLKERFDQSSKTTVFLVWLYASSNYNKKSLNMDKLFWLDLAEKQLSDLAKLLRVLEIFNKKSSPFYITVFEKFKAGFVHCSEVDRKNLTKNELDYYFSAGPVDNDFKCFLGNYLATTEYVGVESNEENDADSDDVLYLGSEESYSEDPYLVIDDQEQNAIKKSVFESSSTEQSQDQPTASRLETIFAKMEEHPIMTFCGCFAAVGVVAAAVRRWWRQDKVIQLGKEEIISTVDEDDVCEHGNVEELCHRCKKIADE